MILLDGVPYEGSIAPFDLSDRGLTLGDGLFETMTVRAGVVHRLDDHLGRLQAGLAVLGFAVPLEKLEHDVLALATRASADGGVLRLTVTRGGGARGLAPPREPRPTVLVSLASLDPRLVGEPVRLATASTRRNDHSPLSRLKTLGYLDNVLAMAEARATGADDALILNTASRVACASVANVFRLAGRRLETPPVADGVLPGIVRARVLDLAVSLGFEPLERSLGREDLLAADGVFLTNSVRLVQPVTALDGNGLPDAMTAGAAAVLAALRDEVGGNT